MYQIIVQILTLSFFAGSACAVFYLPGSVVSYPKMGKRAFYTNATGNRYPLMGRRSSPPEDRPLGKPNDSNNNIDVIGDGSSYKKRGVFTQGPHRSFPRIGRSGNMESPSQTKIRTNLLRILAERLNRNVLDGAAQSPGANRATEEARTSSGADNSGEDVPMSQFLFLYFDVNEDGQLSKAEFTGGLDRVIEQNLLC